MLKGKGGLGSTKFVAFETQAWHNECFICNICKGSMIGKGFIQVKIRITYKGNIIVELDRTVQTSFVPAVQKPKWSKNMRMR